MFALVGPPIAAEEAVQPEPESPESGVTVIKSDGTVMYRYLDESGQIIIQDKPPAEYFEPELAEEGEGLEPVEPQPVPLLAVEPAPAAPSLADRVIRVVQWLAAIALLAGGLYLLAAPVVRKWLSEPVLARVLRKEGFPVFFDVAVKSGPRTHAEIDCLARTPSGILVLGLADLEGQISGRHDADAWIVTNKNDTYTVNNPLLKNLADTAVVQDLVGDVAVHGRVVYTGHAKFSSGKPGRVQSIAALRESLEHFATGRYARQRKLQVAWRTLMRFPRSNVESPRGSGWEAWLRRHWHAVAGALLTGLSASGVLALIMTGGSA